MRKLLTFALVLSTVLVGWRALSTPASAAQATPTQLPISIEASAAMCQAALSDPESFRATSCVTDGVAIAADIVTVRYGDHARTYVMGAQRLDLQMTHDESHECDGYGGEAIWYPADPNWVYCENVDT